MLTSGVAVSGVFQHRHRMNNLFPIALLSAATCLVVDHAVAEDDTQLGPAPLPDPSTEITHVYGPEMPATVVIDPQDRDEVADAYISIYLAQAAEPIGWNGNVGLCLAGTTTQAYRQATIDRVNFYRALASLPGNLTLLGGTQAIGTQAAALMFSANQQLSHDPPLTWICWNPAGDAAAANSNIALGYGDAAIGPGAVDLYIDDHGQNNGAVGHRRWLLYPPQKQMDSGSIPYAPQLAANALWVFSGWGTRPPTPDGVAWPPSGHVPWQVLPDASNRWSFSWDGANFANATVSMTRDGVPLGLPQYEPVTAGYGDNTLVWRPQGVSYARPDADITYRVTINGISGGGAPASIAYDVVVIDPWVREDTVFRDGFDP
jgi:hypothetical protein